MSESISIRSGTKEDQYQSLLPQIFSLLNGETDLIANMANISAALKEQFGWLWIGFYIVKQNQLVLGPFQGPIACTRINFNQGVCGTAWARKETMIVPDVEFFPGHIACSSLSRSEIVVPLIQDDKVFAVLDIDSSELNAFDTIDQSHLEYMISRLEYVPL